MVNLDVLFATSDPTKADSVLVSGETGQTNASNKPHDVASLLQSVNRMTSLWSCRLTDRILITEEHKLNVRVEQWFLKRQSMLGELEIEGLVVLFPAGRNSMRPVFGIKHKEIGS